MFLSKSIGIGIESYGVISLHRKGENSHSVSYVEQPWNDKIFSKNTLHRLTFFSFCAIIYVKLWGLRLGNQLHSRAAADQASCRAGYHTC
ncbi:hypothetical protein BREVNS_1418 [Brevinematales bacterium NS]|nr:hypothetical protein BREVNS_1418 [Brevinematales bacterium NS]